jgi:hypothetical protein
MAATDNKIVIGTVSTSVRRYGGSSGFAGGKGPAKAAGQTNPDTVTPPHGSMVPYAEALGVKEQQNAQAAQIRRRAEAMSIVGNSLGKMRQALEGIVKQYPPYPPGSAQRERYLKSIAGIRKQIEALMVPPQRDHSAAIGISPGSQADPLGIASLGTQSSDTAVAQALRQVGRAADALVQQQKDLAGQVQTSSKDQQSAMALSLDLGKGLARLNQGLTSQTGNVAGSRQALLP